MLPLCIYSIASRLIAARSLWSYRHHNPHVPIVAVGIGAAPGNLRRTAERDRVELVEIPEAALETSRFDNAFLTATLSRFVDLPELLPPARGYLMVDDDTLCLRPLPLEDLFERMVESGASFAAAPDEGPDVWRPYLLDSRRKLDRFGLGHLAIDPGAPMFNAGVVAWRPMGDAAGLPAAYNECLREVEAAGDAIYRLSCPDQVILNVLAQRHAGGPFQPLDPAWNERRAYCPRQPGAASGTTPMIWHCRHTFDRLWDDCYGRH
jgi:hypothetical protein